MRIDHCCDRRLLEDNQSERAMVGGDIICGRLKRHFVEHFDTLCHFVKTLSAVLQDFNSVEASVLGITMTY